MYMYKCRSNLYIFYRIIYFLSEKKKFRLFVQKYICQNYIGKREVTLTKTKIKNWFKGEFAVVPTDKICGRS